MTAQTRGPVAQLVDEAFRLLLPETRRKAAAHDAEDACKDEALRTAREALRACRSVIGPMKPTDRAVVVMQEIDAAIAAIEALEVRE